MSYDFTLFKLQPGADINEVAEMDPPAAGKPDTRQVVALAPADRKAIKSIIARHFPDLDGQEGEELGLEIEAFGNEVGIGIAYWHEGKRAAEVFQKVWNLLEDLQAKCGLTAYDPQIGRGLNLQKDLKEAVKVYTQTMKAIG